jgi:rhodanese-related sulfurtransferase
MKFNLAILLLIVSLIACSNKTNEQSSSSQDGIAQNSPISKDINAADAKKLMETKKDLVILDVRTAEEVSQGTIPNAKVIDIYNADFEKMVSMMDKSKPTLVYCKAGSRSKKACDAMTKLGFKELYNLEGGYDSWR